MSDYGDDLAIAHITNNKNKIIASMQPEEDKVVAWSAIARLALGASRCGAGLSKALRRRPGNHTSPWTKSECLAIPSNFVWTLVAAGSFKEHLRELGPSSVPPHRPPLGGTNWGWHTVEYLQVYITVVRSMVEYTAATWATWPSATTTSKLERVQLAAAMVITGLVFHTPVEADLTEVWLPHFNTFPNHFHHKRQQVGPSPKGR